MNDNAIDLENQVLVAERIQSRSNPFPGLRPFTMDESHLFFGREGQSDEVLRKLALNKFVAIIGSSGAGKSSFVFCGVIPILYGGFLTNIGTNWDVVVMRPGGGPIDNLADALVKNDPKYPQFDDEERKLQKTIVATLLRSSSLGLIEAVNRHTTEHQKSTLIIVDQFEELFRFKKSEESVGSSESIAFVNLLVEATKDKDAPIYIALTMRSDFIGDCAHYPSLTKLINDSNYLIPQMTREQKRVAITGPVAVFGARVSPRLTQQILSDLGDNPDQLPIMAHALMRTYDYWSQQNKTSEPLDLPHYEAIGSMSGALSQHANEAYDELNSRQKEICTILFKCLTEKSGEADGIRRPTKVNVISRIAGCTDEEIMEIVEVFRRPGRSLLTPPHGITLQSNSIIDISHESLMRIWVRLKNWVDEEGQAVDMYLRLSDASAKYQLGKAGLWRPPDLQLALNWQEKNNPTLEWAQRYNPAFERTMVFLETSKKTFETEQKVKEEMQKARLRNSRRIAVIMGSIAIVALVAFVYAFILKVEADAATAKATEKEKEAKTQSLIAQKNAEEALKQKTIAQQKQEEALVAAEEARKQAEIAHQNAIEAEHQKQLAQSSAELAKQQQRIAEEQTKLAKESERVAQEQKVKAERASSEAFKSRIRSIAQAMAVKSLQIYDTTARALVAQQAYIFNRDNDGNPHNHDVYDGLYYATKHLFHDHHNSLKAHKAAVRSIVYAPNGQMAYSAGSDGLVFSWNLNEDKFGPKRLLKNDFVNRAMVISKDGKSLLLLGEEGWVQLLDVSGSSKPKKWKITSKPLQGASFVANDEWAIATTDSLYLLNWATMTSKPVYGMAKGKIKTIASVSNSKVWYLGDDAGTVHIIDGASGEKTLVNKNMRKLHALAVSSDGKIMAVGDEMGQLKLWDLENSKLIANLVGHRARINELRFSPDNSVLASASFDGSVRLWDLAHLNEQPIVLRDHSSWVWSAAFHPNGTHILIACVDNLIRMYPTDAKSMAEKICSQLKRNMTPDEWTLYVAKDIAYEYTCPDLPQGKNKELE